MWPFKKQEAISEPVKSLALVPEPIPVNERLIHLRIKIKSLAAEAMSIREEARKVHGMVKWELNHHRTTTVRWHARHNLLAYGLLRGTPYEVMEKKCNGAPSFMTVEKHAKTFGGTEEEITAWVENAKRYLKENK
jgi:acetyl-CoA acetyltransferase